MSGYIYLGSPYSHHDEVVRGDRYTMACMKAARLMKQGYVVFSPIAHSHAVANFLPPDLLMCHEFWMHQDLPLLTCADKLVVLTIEGWRDSKGLACEIRHAEDGGLPIEYHDMEGIVFPV